MARDWAYIRHIHNSSIGFFHSPAVVGQAATTALGQDVIYAVPYATGDGGTLASVGLKLFTGGSAELVARIGIYRKTSSGDLYPAALFADVGSLVLPSTTVQVLSTAVALPPHDLVWFSYIANGAVNIVPALGDMVLPVLGTTYTALNTTYGNLSLTHSYGAAWPATFPNSGLNTTGGVPLFLLTYSGF